MARGSLSSEIGAQATAIVTGSFLSGAMMGLSLMAVPVFLDTNTQPFQLLQQWARLYYYGHQLMPTTAIATCLLYGYATFTRRNSRREWQIYAVASVATLSMVPFTWIIMVPTNNALFRLESEGKSTAVVDEITSLGHVQGLVVTWSWLHVVRSLFPLVGAILGFAGTLQEVMS